MEFQDPKTGLSGIYATYKRNKLKFKDVSNILHDNTGYQLNKQIKNTAYFPITGRGEGSYQADLMFLPSYKGIGICLCCINVNTRYAYVYAMRNKAETLKYIEEFVKQADFEGRPVIFLQTDNGSEFVNSKAKQFYSENEIKFNAVAPGDHAGQGKVERFNQTFRRLVNLYISSNNTNDWVQVLDDLLYNYNHRYHRSLGCSPIEANEKTEIVAQMKQYMAAKIAFDKYKIGDKVRILKNKDVFDKGRQNWGTKIYKIDDIRGHLLSVNDKWLKSYQLQIIKNGADAADDFEVVAKQDKKEKKIVRALRKEGIIRNDDVLHIERRKREKKVDDYIGRKYRRKYGKKYYVGKVIEFEGDGDWIVEYDEEIKDKNILDKKYERVTKTELDLYSKK